MGDNSAQQVITGDDGVQQVTMGGNGWQRVTTEYKYNIIFFFTFFTRQRRVYQLEDK